jgi:hypothetical protein
MNCTFINFSIEAKCLDGAAPLHCCVVGPRGLKKRGLQTKGVEEPEHVEHDNVVVNIAAAFGAIFELE